MASDCATVWCGGKPSRAFMALFSSSRVRMYPKIYGKPITFLTNLINNSWPLTYHTGSRLRAFTEKHEALQFFTPDPAESCNCKIIALNPL